MGDQFYSNIPDGEDPHRGAMQDDDEGWPEGEFEEVEEEFAEAGVQWPAPSWPHEPNEASNMNQHGYGHQSHNQNSRYPADRNVAARGVHPKPSIGTKPYHSTPNDGGVNRYPQPSNPPYDNRNFQPAAYNPNPNMRNADRQFANKPLPPVQPGSDSEEDYEIQDEDSRPRMDTQSFFRGLNEKLLAQTKREPEADHIYEVNDPTLNPNYHQSDSSCNFSNNVNVSSCHVSMPSTNHPVQTNTNLSERDFDRRSKPHMGSQRENSQYPPNNNVSFDTSRPPEISGRGSQSNSLSQHGKPPIHGKPVNTTNNQIPRSQPQYPYPAHVPTSQSQYPYPTNIPTSTPQYPCNPTNIPTSQPQQSYNPRNIPTSQSSRVPPQTTSHRPPVVFPDEEITQEQDYEVVQNGPNVDTNVSFEETSLMQDRSYFSQPGVPNMHPSHGSPQTSRHGMPETSSNPQFSRFPGPQQSSIPFRAPQLPKSRMPHNVPNPRKELNAAHNNRMKDLSNNAPNERFMAPLQPSNPNQAAPEILKSRKPQNLPETQNELTAALKSRMRNNPPNEGFPAPALASNPNQAAPEILKSRKPQNLPETQNELTAALQNRMRNNPPEEEYPAPPPSFNHNHAASELSKSRKPQNIPESKTELNVSFQRRMKMTSHDTGNTNFPVSSGTDESIASEQSIQISNQVSNPIMAEMIRKQKMSAKRQQPPQSRKKEETPEVVPLFPPQKRQPDQCTSSPKPMMPQKNMTPTALIQDVRTQSCSVPKPDKNVDMDNKRAATMPHGTSPCLPPTTQKPVKKDKDIKTCITQYDFDGGGNPDCLLFSTGDVITILNRCSSGWWTGTLHGKTGLFPENYVEVKDAEINETVGSGTKSTELKQQPWYGGKMDRTDVEAQLKARKQDGYFVIRDSNQANAQAPYSISLYFGGKVTHLRIPLRSGGYCLGESGIKEFTTLPALVEYYKTNDVTLKDGGKTVLVVI